MAEELTGEQAVRAGSLPLRHVLNVMLPVADATEPEQVIAGLARWVKAEEIIRAMAAEWPQAIAGGNYSDYCSLCGADVPWVKLAEREQQGHAVCPRHPDDKGHYAVGSVAFCGEARVAVTVPVMGHAEGAEYHHPTCTGRMAREWVQSMDEARESFTSLSDSTGLWPCGCLINKANAHRVGCPDHPDGYRGYPDD